jgi:hypothetical protein
MPTDKQRIMVSLDEATYELLQNLNEMTGVPISTIIVKVLGGHLHELWEYHDWLKRQPKGSRNRSLGVNLLQSYGPDALLDGVRRLDQGHTGNEIPSAAPPRAAKK